MSTLNDARIDVEALIETVREENDPASIDTGLMFALKPGRLNKSETLSFLDCVLRAIKQFNPELQCKIDVRTVLIHPGEEEFVTRMMSRVEKVRELHEKPSIQKV